MLWLGSAEFSINCSVSERSRWNQQRRGRPPGGAVDTGGKFAEEMGGDCVPVTYNSKVDAKIVGSQMERSYSSCQMCS
jgi:hypothetical protein